MFCVLPFTTDLANQGMEADESNVGPVDHPGWIISPRYISRGGEISLQGVNSFDNELKNALMSFSLSLA